MSKIYQCLLAYIFLCPHLMYASTAVGAGGGDPVEIYLVRGRLLAHKILSTLKPEHLGETIGTNHIKWLIGNAKDLASEIMTLDWDWKPIPDQDECGYTQYQRGALIHFDRQICENGLYNVLTATEVLLHEAIHHFGKNEIEAQLLARELMASAASQTALFQTAEIKTMAHEVGSTIYPPIMAWTFDSKSANKKNRVYTWFRQPGTTESQNNHNETGFRELDPDRLNLGWQTTHSTGQYVDNKNFSETIPYNAPVIWSGDDLSAKASNWLFIWGGCKNWDCDEYYGKGVLFNTQTHYIEQISQKNAPIERRDHAAVQIGHRILVWGGKRVNVFSTGDTSWKLLNDGRYFNLESRQWENLPQSSWIPSPRSGHTLTNTGKQIILFGGCQKTKEFFDDCIAETCEGASFDVATSKWQPIPTPDFNLGCLYHQAVWTGQKLIVFGGRQQFFFEDQQFGGAYDPATKTWEKLPWVKDTRFYHQMLWTGRDVVVAGGWTSERKDQFDPSLLFYNPKTRLWRRESPTMNMPDYEYFTVVWTGLEFVFLGRIEDYSGVLGLGKDKRHSFAYNPYLTQGL